MSAPRDGGHRPVQRRRRAGNARRFPWLGFGVALLILAAAPTGAQAPAHASLVLQVPASTRATAMGGAAVALRDVESIFANPAAVGLVTGSAASFARFGRGARLGSVASSGTAGPMGIAVGAQLLGFHARAAGVPQPSDALTLRESSTEGTSATASFAVATTFRGWRAGAALKYVNEQVAAEQGSTAAVDIGVLKERGRTTYGASLQNFGADLDVGGSAAPLPLRGTVGATVSGVPVGAFDVGGSASVSALQGGELYPAAGVELAYSWLEGLGVAARIGARRPEIRELLPLTGGASFTFDRLSVEYAFEDLRHGVAHRLALRLR